MSGLDIHARVLKVGGRTLAEELLIEVPAGELHVLEGPNGSGKSYLLDVVTGVASQRGTVARLAGKRLAGDSYARWRSGLRRMFQTPLLPETLTVAHVASLIGRPWDEIAQKLDDIDASTTLGRLSYGYRRLVELLVALSDSPRAVLLDEPLAGLHARLTDRMVPMITSAMASGTAFLAVDHTGMLRDHVARRAYSWPLIQPTSTPPRMAVEVFAKSRQDFAARIENFTLPGRDAPLITKAMISLGPGEAIILTGPNGSGKSSLLRALADVPPRTWRGEVQIVSKPPARILFAPQPPKLVETFTPVDNVQLMVTGSLKRSDGKVRDRLWKLLLDTGIPTASLRLKAGNLSGGEQAMISLIGVLSSDASLVLLDEPTEAMSSVWAESAISTLLASMRETGRSLVIASHDQRLINRLSSCTRVDLGSNHDQRSSWRGSLVH